MTLAWSNEKLEMHNEAWKQAKFELLGSEDANITFDRYSKVAKRAEEIRQSLERKAAQ